MNTLLVTVDALRADHTAQHGYDRDTFPVLDRVGDVGTRFTAAFANGTNTGVSMPSLLTSRYRGTDPGRSGPTMASVLPDDVTTGLVHSNAYFAARLPDPAGFDTVDDFGVAGDVSEGRGTNGGTVDDEATLSVGHRTFRALVAGVKPPIEALGLADFAERVEEAIVPARFIHEASVYAEGPTVTARALEWIDSVDEPFFCWIHYMDPHRPYGIDIDDPAYGPPADRERIHDLMATAGIHPDRIGPEDRDRIVDLYDSDLRYASRAIDGLFDGLQERRLWDDTNVILTADHGEEFGDHGRFFHRNRPYDELIHVPLAMKRAANGTNADRAARTVDAQRELLDLAPTVAAFHDVDPPAAFRGTRLFAGEQRQVLATGSFDADAPAVGARWDGYKYITVGGDEELYDLSADPDEEEDRAGAEPAVCSEYRTAIPDHLLEDGHAGVPDAVDPAVEDRLADLGYRE